MPDAEKVIDGDGHVFDERFAAQLSGDRLGELARLLAGGLGEHHRGVGRHVAVRRLARGLDQDAGKIKPGGQCAFFDQRSDRAVNAREDCAEDIVWLRAHG